MSERYPGGFISKTAPTVTTSSAQGVWTMEQQAAYQKAGTWPFGGPFNYIEDVFSTYLYTGNSSTQTITNGIDLAGKGGMAWLKTRDSVTSHAIFDTARGVSNKLSSDTTGAASTSFSGITAFNANGFSLGAVYNTSPTNYVSWTFRKQAKFFDVVTYTGNGATYAGGGRLVSHNLQCRPGFILIKRTDSTGEWFVGAWNGSIAYYVSDSSTPSGNFFLNSSTGAGTWSATEVTPTVNSTINVTTLDYPNNNVNINGASYVMYVWAAGGAGGFGLTGTDEVIKCGSFTGNGSGDATVTLGYEPQWLLYKKTNAAGSWYIADNMRNGLLATGASSYKALYPNNSNAEAGSYTIVPTATGFQMVGGDPDTFIYIAIRRGPMKTPTSGTSVFSPLSFNSSSSAQTINPGITTDLCMLNFRNTTNGFEWFDRLRGITGTTGSGNPQITSASTAAEVNSTDINGAGQTTLVAGGTLNGYTQIVECFRRAPSFMDVVCYTGTGAVRTVAHNLGVAPEFMIVRRRTVASQWYCYVAPLGATGDVWLNTTKAATYSNLYWNNTNPTASVFTLGSSSSVNDINIPCIAYLFASCTGVSKVGSYSGTGATQTISCGFAARFVLIKRTDSTGDWWVWDTARGMVSGTDPRLGLNLTTAETNANWVYTDASGFQIVTTDATVNASGGSYIYLAIA